jgi:hypothetical protein
MDQIEVTIPSKMVGFGNVRPFIQVEDASNLAEVALGYLTAVMEYQQHEENIVKAKQGEAAAKLDGEEADAKAPAPEPLSEAPDDGPEDTDEAAATLAEGLGGVTVVEDVEAPWAKAPAAEPVKQAWDEEPSFEGFDWG